VTHTVLDTVRRTASGQGSAAPCRISAQAATMLRCFSVLHLRWLGRSPSFSPFRSSVSVLRNRVQTLSISDRMEECVEECAETDSPAASEQRRARECRRVESGRLRLRVSRSLGDPGAGETERESFIIMIRNFPERGV
jgi:hypothetical protein